METGEGEGSLLQGLMGRIPDPHPLPTPPPPTPPHASISLWGPDGYFCKAPLPWADLNSSSDPERRFLGEVRLALRGGEGLWAAAAEGDEKPHGS